MNPAIRNSLGVFGCLALVCLCVLLVQLSRAAIEIEAAASDAGALLQSSNQSVAEIEKQLTGKYGLIGELTAASRESRKTIDVLQATSLAERKKVAEFSDASIHVVNDLDAVARNGAAVVQGLQETVAGLGRAVTSLQADSDAAKPAIDGATALLATLDKGSGQALGGLSTALGHVDELVVAGRPAVDHMDSMTAHLDDGTKSLAETLGFIRDDFAPTKKSFWVRLLDTATSGMFSVALHWLPQRVKEVK